MKKIIILALAASISFAASADEAPKAIIKKGSAIAYDMQTENQSVIAIGGDAAIKVYKDLDDSLIQGLTDASENNGTQVVQKSGENILCSAFIKKGKMIKAQCEITLDNKKTGKAGQGGVG